MSRKYRILLPFCIVLIVFAGAIETPAKPPARTDGAVATSEVKRGGQKPQQLSANVTGFDALTLTAVGYSWGQAVWGNPKLVDAKGAETRLVDLKPTSVRVGWGTFSRNKGPDNRPLSIGGVKIPRGLFAHANSAVVYKLSGKYVRFEAQVGINHTAGDKGSVVFKVFDAKSFKKSKTFKIIGKSIIPNTPEPPKKKFSRETLASLEKAITKLIAAGSGNTAAAKKALAEIQSCIKSFDEISKGLDAGEPEAMKRTEALWAIVRTVRVAELDAPLLFVKQHPYYAPHIYDDYLPYRPGGGIYVIENPTAPIDQHIVRAIIDPKTPETLGVGVYRDPDLSFDAKRLVFAFKGEDGNTSIYEIGVDGKGLKRLTNPGYDCRDRKPSQGLYGRGQHDVTPCYLPSGRIAFTSTRTGAHVMCFSNYIDVLHTMNGDGSDIRCISVNNQTEFDPSVLPDGRIIYGRWEYIDKSALYMQSLWTVNPDGSNETAFFANNLAKPTAVLDARAVPGTDLVVASLTPHNGQAVGAIAMIDSKVGKNSLDAITNFTPEYPKEMDQGLRRGPCDPWPLSKDVVLFANNAPSHGAHGVIELVDRFGLRAVIHREPDLSCYAPMLVKPRPRPRDVISLIQPGKPATFVVHDIYKGLTGIERGRVKKLRVIETTARVSGIPRGGRWWNQAFLASWQGSYDIKYFLGLVPVEKDGSAYFEAPPGKAIYFQALDAEGRMLQSQRTFVQAAPGIARSCTGCHIKEDNAAPAVATMRPMAARKAPAKLKTESWGDGFLDYPTMVQPVLDKRCVSCHGGEKGIAGGIDLSGGWTYAFNISYETLIKNTLVGFLNCKNGAVQATKILDPLTHGSGAAPLTKLLLGGHKKHIKDMPQKEIDLLLAWMDGNCNYYGTWNYSQHAVANALLSTRGPLLGQIKTGGCLKCHPSEIGSDWVNLKTPARSRILRAPMKKGEKSLGLASCRDRKAAKPSMPFVGKWTQPPDVFAPRKTPAPNPEGKVVTTFADTTNATYQAMLKIITDARAAALKSPRVDMPGAIIERGVWRELAPLGPPVLPKGASK
ncbi:MAG: NPCBM/NEW2 domain-containing protein [Phycisphaerae bacterium]|nr:NPCBM/NEW2 domain-containing protein [Phycisphaerae bacterium]